MVELALALLPVAAATGWYVAHKHYKNSTKHSTLDHSTYFQGLNHLINEQSDKAVDVFVNLLEIDSETIEVHLALGTLFRKRGEVEKAIRLHQNLMARPELGHVVRLGVLNELGMDYMHAGLLDRAESLFLELEQHPEHRLNVTKQLLSIYQQEKEWLKAINYARKLQSLDSPPQHVLLAHLHCELALMLINSHDAKEAKSNLKKALKYDQLCVRSNLINAEIELVNKKYKVALEYLMSIKQQNNNFVPVFLEMFILCFNQLKKQNEKLQFLAIVESEINSDLLTNAFVLALSEQKGNENAVVFLKNKLSESPRLSDITKLSSMLVDKRGDLEIKTLSDALNALYHQRLHFLCNRCGFDSEKLNWMCPSCKHWGTVTPVNS